LSNPLLSIIIPAYNEEIRLPNTLAQVTSFLNTQAYPAEVLVVENGSRDRTLEIARDFSRRFSYVKALHVDGRGKGLAVKYGMQQATGDYRFICDADLSMPIKEVNCFIPPILPVMDIAIASREAPGAVRYHEPLFRHLTGRFFILL
jgi:dolichyl-phosphate beta-glucosyltransferase